MIEVSNIKTHTSYINFFFIQQIKENKLFIYVYICIYTYTSVKKDLKSPPPISTLGHVVTVEGMSSWPLWTCFLLYVTVIFVLGVKESRTSPMTLPITSGSVDTLAIVTATR